MDLFQRQAAEELESVVSVFFEGFYIRMSSNTIAITTMT